MWEKHGNRKSNQISSWREQSWIRIKVTSHHLSRVSYVSRSRLGCRYHHLTITSCSSSMCPVYVTHQVFRRLGSRSYLRTRWLWNRVDLRLPQDFNKGTKTLEYLYSGAFDLLLRISQKLSKDQRWRFFDAFWFPYQIPPLGMDSSLDSITCRRITFGSPSAFSCRRMEKVREEATRSAKRNDWRESDTGK